MCARAHLRNPAYANVGTHRACTPPSPCCSCGVQQPLTQARRHRTWALLPVRFTAFLLPGACMTAYETVNVLAPVHGMQAGTFAVEASTGCIRQGCQRTTCRRHLSQRPRRRSPLWCRRPPLACARCVVDRGMTSRVVAMTCVSVAATGRLAVVKPVRLRVVVPACGPRSVVHGDDVGVPHRARRGRHRERGGVPRHRRRCDPRRREGDRRRVVARVVGKGLRRLSR